MLLIIDNYDSFVYNLAHYVQELSHDCLVRRNDQLQLEDVECLNPSHIIISPGPCAPKQAGISVPVIKKFGSNIPILGVCLGHQSIGEAYGGVTTKAKQPMHGKVRPVQHNGRGVFAGLPDNLPVTRYHSLVIDPETIPEELEVTAVTEQDEIMAMAHKLHPVVGVQFHPEAVLTQGGHQLLKNFIDGRYR